MLGLLLTLLSTLDVPPPEATTSLSPPAAVLAALPTDYIGNAAAPGACTGPLPAGGYGVVGLQQQARSAAQGRIAEPPTLFVRLAEDPKAGRVGGCGTPVPAVLHRVTAPPDLRLVAASEPVAPALPTTLEPLSDLTTHRCVTRETLRSYASLVLLGGPLAGFAIELSPSRSLVTARLLDARKSPAVVYPLGRVGVRTLEWCDRTDVAEGACPNPAHGEVRQAVLVGDQLVLTMALGFADVCGQDDLILRAFTLPPAVRRSLPAL